MKFEFRQSWNSAADDVQAAYLDPAFLELMATLPKLGAPQLLDQQTEAETVSRQIRYRFVGDLNAAVLAVVEREKLSWIEESRTDLHSRITDWKIRPDNYADRLAGRGRSVISRSDDGSGTSRITTGEVKVNMFLVGGKVEGAIVSGMREHAEAEQAAMARFLEAR